jgi:hypothetical protein
MSKKVIVSECSHNTWTEVFKKAARENGWQPVYWTGHSRFINFNELKESFSGITIHENYDAIRGVPIKSLQNLKLSPVDGDLLKSFAEHESIVLKMMDRMDPMGWFTYPDRLRLYHYYLKYWSHVLDYFEPDIFFTPVTPHLCYDYVLYQLCKWKNITCILFIETTIPYIIYINNSFEEMPLRIIERYKHLLSTNAPALLSESSNKYLYKILGNYSQALPSYMIDQFRYEKKINEKKSYFRQSFDLARNVASYFKHKYITKSLFQDSNVYYKSKSDKIEQKMLTRLEMKHYSKIMTRRTTRLRTSYENILSKVDYNSPYILVALMYQPERTSSPDGGVFVHQYLMIELLSAAIPKDWTIYVKEHATQFMMYIDQTRNDWFYQDILKLGNAKFVDTNLDTYQLIDNSKAVATLTGTIGFESIVRGKPALCFGYAWYRGCEGVFSVDSLKTLRMEIEKIENGYTPDTEKVKKYVQALEETGIRGFVEPYYEKGFDFFENVNNLKEAIVGFEVKESIKRSKENIINRNA